MTSKMETSLLRLELELGQWEASGQQPKMFLRDDDAIDVTGELRRLTQAVERWNIPLLLAVIPKFATVELSQFVKSHKLITPAVHGYSHKNHAPENKKKCEFGDERSLKTLVEDLENGRNALLNLFPYNLSNLFVPPWNRIGEKAVNACQSVGFEGISRFGWKNTHEKVSVINTHVDVIDWKNGKIGKSADVLISELCENFRIARVNGNVPIGLLTHHLVHDDEMWLVLDEVFQILDTNQIKWIPTG